MLSFQQQIRTLAVWSPMSRKHHDTRKMPPKPDPAPTPAEAAETQEELANAESEGMAQPEAAAGPAEESTQGAAGLAEPAPSSTEQLERELAEWKERAMRAAADFDNYRKRAVKERDEAAGRGQAQAFERIIDVIEDVARVAHLDPAKTSAEALHEGMLNIERKFLRTLEAAGLEQLDPTGQPFDPKTQEAVTTMPAPNEESDQTVGSTFQKGYRYKGVLLRPARVVVYQWTGQAPGGAAH
jgi:molecular chaperone GrpE